MTSPPSSANNGCLGAGVLLVLILSAVGLFRTLQTAPADRATPPTPASGSLVSTDAEPRPADTLFTWDEAEARGSAYSAGGLRITLTARATEGLRAPVLVVLSPDGATLEVIGAARDGVASAEVGVGRLDPASPHNQVLFTTFSGGAHCCAEIKVLDHLDGAWRSIDIGAQDGDRLGAFPRDLDGDGQREIELIDGRFLYAFASYAESLAPPVIKALSQGELRDVSAEPRFRKVYETYLPQAKASCVAHNNGACPAFVAAAIRAGQSDEAWATMLGAYDPASSWSLPTACRTAGAEPCAAPDQVKFRAYPEALRWFLGDLGYLPAVFIAPPDAAAPSFDCGVETAEIPTLICATSELAAADRELAWLTWRAKAVSADPNSVTQSAREFLRIRDDAPPDAFTLLRLYQARLQTLAAILGD